MKDIDDLTIKRKIRSIKKARTALKRCLRIHQYEHACFCYLVGSPLPKEILKYKPKQGLMTAVYWFPLDDEGVKQRIEICDKVIKNLEAKIKKKIKNNGKFNREML